jgi:hypothetical protein
VLPARKEVRLQKPLLVFKGKHYVPLVEFAKLCNATVKTDKGLQLIVGEKSVSVETTKIDSKYLAHKVESFRAVHQVVVTTEPLKTRRSLYKEEDVKEFPKGSTLLVRRTVEVDGKRSVVLTDCGPELASYLADADEVEKKTVAGKLEGTAWGAARRWFDAQSVTESALRYGDREKLSNSVCLTVDLCWSLRPAEQDLFGAIREAAKTRRGGVAPVLFLTGRWVEQHPGEMQELIELADRGGVEVTWGLHTYAHPKYGNFLNDFSREQVREDNQHVERLLLEWGVVPSAFYRFPGLVHDRERLDVILDLDLFPIDCDSWMAVVEREKNKEKKGPFGQPVSDGSIILVHGNGNEPEGIPPLLKWLDAHPDWSLAPLYRFMPGQK